MTLASWGGLAVAITPARDAHRRRSRLRSAETLGADYRTAFAPEVLAMVGEDRAARAWQSPFRRRERGVERIRDIAYGPAGERNRLDVFRPVQRAERCPTLIYIHGGAWVTGSHDDLQGLPLMLRLASLGWVCVKPGYRLGPQATFPDQLVDVKRALAWIREHGAEYGADPDFVIVTGGSAGGSSRGAARIDREPPRVPARVRARRHKRGRCGAALRRLRPARPQPRASRHEPDRLPEEARPQVRARREPRAVGGVLSLSQVHPDAPPFFVVHGRNDSLLFFEDARHFVEALRKTSRQHVVHAEIPHAQHAFELLHTVRASAVVDGVVRYLEYIRATERDIAASQGERNATG